MHIVIVCRFNLLGNKPSFVHIIFISRADSIAVKWRLSAKHTLNGRVIVVLKQSKTLSCILYTIKPSYLFKF